MRLLSLVTLLLIAGCGPLTVGPDPGPSPAPPIKREADAAKCFDQYRSQMASAMRAAAAELRQPGVSQLDVASRLGDAMKAARIEAFEPLTSKLDECESPEQMAELWDRFASQLEGR